MSLRALFNAAPIFLGLLPVVMTGCGDSDEPGAADVPVAGEAATAEGAAASAGSATSKMSESDRLVQTAVAQIQERQFRQALDTLNKAVESGEDNAEAHFQRAGILADAGQDTNALADYDKAIELKPRETRYLNMKGLFLLTRQHYDAAAQVFTKALGVDPKFSKALNNRGLVSLALNKFEAAASDFQTAIQVEPKYVDAYNNLGFAWYQAGEYDDALKAFNQSLELNPTYINAFNNRGMLYLKTEKLQLAVADFSKAIELESGNIKHYQSRMAAYRAMGRDDLAKADEDKARWLIGLAQIDTKIRQAPDSPQSYIQRASHLAEGGHSDIALATFEKALELAPGNVDALARRAQFWLDHGEPQKAVADCNAALDSLKASGEWSYKPLSIRGDALFTLGRLDEAIADFTAARRLDGSVAEAYYERAKLRHSQGDKAGSQSDLATARKLNPSVGQPR
jgi:tetratricopeptide (TPR) repeat protein